jgi:hypothetical protein
MITEGFQYGTDPETHAPFGQFTVDGQIITLTGFRQGIGYGKLSYQSSHQLHDDLCLITTDKGLSVTGFPESDTNMFVEAIYVNGKYERGILRRYGYFIPGPSFFYGFKLLPDMSMVPRITDAHTLQSYDPKTFRYTRFTALGSDDWEIQTSMDFTKIHLYRQGLAWQISGGVMTSQISFNPCAVECLVRDTTRELQSFSAGRSTIETLAPVLKDLWEGFVGDKI